MFGERVHPDDAHVKATLLTWLRDGMPQHSVSAARYRVRHADGHWVWVTSTAQVIRAEDGTPLEVQGFMLDISNLVSAEEEIGARLKEAQQARDVAERSLAQVDALRAANEALTRTLDLEHVLQALLDSSRTSSRGRAGVFLLDGRARLVLQRSRATP